jgi:Mrp family chromosome partitioning ATPase
MSEETNSGSTDKLNKNTQKYVEETQLPATVLLSRNKTAKKPAHFRENVVSAADLPTSISIPTPASAPAPVSARPPAPIHSQLLVSGKLTKEAQVLRTRCRQIGVSVFFRTHAPARSLGFTSAIQGEGKTFIARMTAEVMAEDNGIPVTLLECNWENPTLTSVYNLPPGPGLTEWLQGTCSLDAIRQPVTSNLTVIPAGGTGYNVTPLLRTLQQRGIESVLTKTDEVLLVDLPATVTTAYGPLAAHLVDTLILVVHMGVTPEAFVAEASNYLKDMHVEGVVLNQVVSNIPRWLRRLF